MFVFTHSDDIGKADGSMDDEVIEFDEKNIIHKYAKIQTIATNILGNRRKGTSNSSPGTLLTSPSGLYKLVLEPNGELKSQDVVTGQFVWGVLTSNYNKNMDQGTDCTSPTLNIQNGGNVVLKCSGTARWASNTNIGADSGPYKLTLTNTGKPRLRNGVGA